MMVEGGHLEDAPALAGEALCDLEIRHLDDVRQGLHDEDEAEGNEDQRHVIGEGQRRDRPAEKEGARVPHEALGGVEVIDNEAAQAPHHAGGEDAELLVAAAPGQGDRHEEQEYRQRRAACKAVDPVRDVHGVDRADDDEDREHHIQPLGHIDRLMHKGHIQMRAHKADLPHEQDEHQGRGELQQELAAGAQAHVLFLFELFPVVEKADQPEHAGKQQHKDMLEAAVQHPVKADGQAHQGDRENKDHAAHGGGAGFGPVPLDLAFDLLSGLLTAQPGDIVFSERAGKQEGQHEGANQLDGHKRLRCSERLSAALFSLSASPPRSPVHPCGAFHAR